MAPLLPRGRGAALLSAMVTVAVLTALAMDLAYQSRVSLRIAANARDELRANYLARSGVAMGRLVLSFQQQLDDSMPHGAGVATPRVQLWRAIPVSSALLGGLFGAPAAEAGKPPPSLFEGPQQGGPGFEADLDDESLKVNAQLEANPKTGPLAAQILAFYQLICDPRWDPVFDQEDASGQKSTREDVILRLRDWVDEDERSSSLVATSGAAACQMVPARVPIEDAFGDENGPYDRGDDRYKVRNGRMDSLAELYLVAGVNDAFMAAFGDALTVYLPRDAKRNVNELDKDRLLQLVKMVADPPGQPALLDATFLERLQQVIAKKTYGGLLALTPPDFGQCVELAGVKINATALAEGPNSLFTDRSNTFRILARGTAGDVRSRVDAVVRMEKPTQGEVVAAPGRLIHWRED